MKKIIMMLMISIVLVYGFFEYQVTYKKNEIITYNYDNYTLTIFMLGEPEWPFGKTNCCFELVEKNKGIVEYKFSVRNDGAFVHENNFDVRWYNDYAIISVSGEEQRVVDYKVEYSGKVVNL